VPFPPAIARNQDESFVLEDVADDLCLRAATGGLGRLDRRDGLIERVLAALCSPGGKSVMLVGPPDVGKTALVHELATRLAAGNVPAPLRGQSLWRISANDLIAGARYTGMWQDRARALVQGGRGGTIFAMGDPIGIIDAGRWSESSNNLSRHLRPYAESGELALICECSPEALAAAQKTEPSFVAAFHRVDVPEPPVEEAREILAAAAARLSDDQSVLIDSDAVAAAIELTIRFEPYRSLPGKAVRLLEETVQHAVMRREQAARIAGPDVIESFALRSGLPRIVLSDELPLAVRDVHEFFESRVLGQEEAVSAVVDLVAVAKANLSAPEKPLGSFFFVGPTGVGKTELSKALAEYLFGSRSRIIRFDMAEFGSYDAVQRLIGTAWNSDGEGELTRRVREEPFCVVLLDEIEKAHGDAHDALLAVLGEGRLTDANGRTADFRNAIVIMTSNLGASRSQTAPLGFQGADAIAEADRLRRHFVEQAERFFRPEFVNRIDRVVVFRPLGEETVRTIARRELGKLLLREGIAGRRLLVEVDHDVIDTLAAAGFDPAYGARPLQRAIERSVIEPLSRLIAERVPEPGDLIRLSVQDGRVSVQLEKVARPEPHRAERELEAEPAHLGRLEKQVEQLVEAVSSESETPAARALTEERSELVVATHEPAFWDDPTDAREVLERLYQLERVLDRLDRLLHRTTGLLELARHLRSTRDRTRAHELRHAIAEVGDELRVARLEIEAAHAGPDRGGAVVRVVGIGTDAERWASSLFAMYVAWAERTGREVAGLPSQGTIRIEGLSSFALLRGEQGLHRLDRSEGSQLARVIVSPLDQDGGGGAADEDAVNEVIRVYSQGRRSFVRDTRTGVRVGNLVAVVERGDLDAFLRAELAALVSA
jgi:ATP-dependent Clp protease ATP-binding subunit ClpA